MALRCPFSPLTRNGRRSPDEEDDEDDDDKGEEEHDDEDDDGDKDDDDSLRTTPFVCASPSGSSDGRSTWRSGQLA